MSAQLVWATQQHIARIGELDLLQLRRDDFDVAIKRELDRFLASWTSPRESARCWIAPFGMDSHCSD
jgi:hypothetical protein